MAFTDPVKVALGRYLERFHAQLIADTPAMGEFAARPFSKACVWAPGRMIDQALDMLEAWRKNDTSQAARGTPLLPVMLVAVSKDFMPAPPDFTRGLSDDYLPVMIPGDAKNRVFHMRAVVADIRTQIAIFAPEEATARSVAMQLHLFASALPNRRFNATYRLSGVEDPWPVVLELPDLNAVAVPTEVKNLTILTVDIQLRATIPMLVRPGAGQEDGKGSDAPDDPDGFLVVSEAHGRSWPGALEEGEPAAEWSVP